MARDHLRQSALARAVGAHDRVYFARMNGEGDAFQDLRVTGGSVQINNFQHCDSWQVSGHQPTLPSKLIPRSFCASTANSMGSSLNTSLQKPLTIMDTASSAEMPRCMQ